MSSKFGLGPEISLIKKIRYFLFWLSGLRTLHSVCGNAASIPGLAQWVKEPALL